MDAPRSIRTFNPGAMNYGPFARKHGAIGTDGRLAIFPDEDTGYKAMSSLLDVYGKRGQNTVSSIIGGLPTNPNLAWAPRGVDNNSTDTYIQKVASKLGIAPDTPITPELRPVLMRAMAEYEAGVPLGSVPRPASPATPVQTSPPTGQPAMTPYTGATPDDVSTQRKMAQALMGQGMSTEPVGHWTQALARVLQGGVGGMYQAQAKQGEQQGNQALAQALSGGTPTAASLVANPWTRDVGKSLFIAEAKQRATAAGPEEYGKAGAVFQDPVTGEFKAIQFGGKGSLKTHPLTGMRPAKGTKQVGDELVDVGTGAPVRNVAPQIAGKEEAEAIGQARGKSAADLPRVLDNANQALETINQIRTHPGKKVGTGVAGIVPAVPGTTQAAFVDLVDQAKGKAFLEAFNSLKGGGQITEVEGKKATDAIARLNRARRVEDFDKALDDFEGIVKSGIERAKKSAVGRYAAPNLDTASQPIPRVASDADYDALPTGAVFLDPNGDKRTKP